MIQIRKSEMEMQQAQQLPPVGHVMTQAHATATPPSNAPVPQQNMHSKIIAQFQQLQMKKEQLRQEQEEVRRTVRLNYCESTLMTSM